MLVTDFFNSYAIFTYYCGDLSYLAKDRGVIGYNVEGDLHKIYESSHGEMVHRIACWNHPSNRWVNIVYNLTNKGNSVIV